MTERRKRSRPASPVAPTLLIVDDEAFLGRALMRSLPDERCVLAATLSEARAWLARGEIFAVLLDVNLGVESGLDLLTELRADGDETPVMVLTGEHRRDVPNGVNLGHAEYALKEDGFLANVRDFVARAHARAAQPGDVAERGLAFARAWGLSPAETRLLAVAIHPSSYEDNARELGISTRTVEGQMQAIRKKTGDATRAELVASVLAGRRPREK